MDTVRWGGSRCEIFSVKSYYNILSSKDNLPFPWQSVWRSKAPNRVTFFAWEACHEAILTGDNLRRRRRIYISWCFMCKENGECKSSFASLPSCDGFVEHDLQFIQSIVGDAQISQRALFELVLVQTEKEKL